MKLLIILGLLLVSYDATADCRSVTVRNHFWRDSGFPYGRPGFWVDHICPLECGGKDAQVNMQWQTEADARSKDRWELRSCKELCTPFNSTYPTRTVFNCKRGK